MMPPIPMAFPPGDNPKKPAKPAKTSTPDTELVNPEPFRACDRCGYTTDGEPIARALFQFEVVGGSLYLCGHCFRKNSDAILNAGYPIRELPVPGVNA